jgi:putative FmdB family regulatory protein
MPIYEYRCAACQHKLESLQKFSDAPLVTCPQCGRGELVKLVSAAGFHLKGSGWYQTDFKNSGSRPQAKKTEGATGEPAAAGESKSTDAATPAGKSDSAAAKPDAPAAKAEAPAAPASSPPAAP